MAAATAPDSPIVFSLVIPAYDEAARLPAFLDAALPYLARRYPAAHEVVVVDDGSADDTAAIAERCGAPVRVLRVGKNRGKGAAVRAGMLAARGAFRLFADADGATAVDQERRLATAIAAGSDVAIGSRAAPGGVRRWWRPGAPTHDRADDDVPHWHVLRRRHVLGRVFAHLVSGMTGLRFADTQCGFKLFTADAARKLFAAQTCDGWAFDVEVLTIARDCGLRVAEIPVTWHETSRSKVRLWRAGPQMLATLWRLRRRRATPLATPVDAPAVLVRKAG